MTPAGQGHELQTHAEGQEPGPEVLQGQCHGLSPAAAQPQRQHQQDARRQPQDQGAVAVPAPAGRWGRGGQ